MFDKYINNDLNNPTYLFHGSPNEIQVIEVRLAHDSNGNIENEDNAVFLTSSFVIASAYAFKDKIKEISKDLEYNFEISWNADSGQLIIKMDNVNIDDEMEGYIYIVPFTSKYQHNGRTIQYKSYDSIWPIDIVKVKFGDFKQFYCINSSNTIKR